MAAISVEQRAYGISYFMTTQLIALIGWIIVQSLFSLSPFGQTIPFPIMMTVETIWWIATLVIMYWLFRRIYNKFVQAVADLEAANNRLRSATNRFLLEKRNQGEQGEEASQEDK
ncbi:MAG TPA: hypothetical protein VEV19_16875 [Ktedonobacteraceae bacterium]|nr:hypothetical protein [Ktedonobacteraceae bacterium]